MGRFRLSATLAAAVAWIACLAAAAPVRGQESTEAPAAGPAAPEAAADLHEEARQFDFWLGEWAVNLRIRQPDGSWPDAVEAVARVYPLLGGKAILELWDSEPIKGMSLRTFDAARGEWVLWLNWPGPNRTQGSSLSGSFRHGRGEFVAHFRRPEDGAELISRYTFSDIAPDRLRWDDAYSRDGGRTWSHNWIMEFSRTAERSAWPEPGEAAPTYASGERCDLPEFRRFEVLAGRRQGTVWRPGDDGRRAETAAELTGFPILDGCGVIARLAWGAGREVLSFITWSTQLGAFEEVRLDDVPGTPLELFRGPAAEGELELVATPFDPAAPDREPPADAAPTGRKLVWRLGDPAAVGYTILESADGGGSWQEVEAGTFGG